MSSLPDVSSLSGLAAYAARVDELFDSGPMDRERFKQLHEMLNSLQVKCPNHEGVLAARVKWYELLLDNFEQQVVESLEYGRRINLGFLYWETLPDMTAFFAGPQTIEHFLRRHYLKGDFPRLYSRALGLYERLVRAKGVSEKHRDYFNKQIEWFRSSLLEGRL